MNTNHAEQVRAMRQGAATVLVALGWTAIDSTAIAEKTFTTAVGPKVAHVYVQDFGAQSKGFILAADYQSEGRNILESRGVLIPKDAHGEQLRGLVEQFAAGVEKAVGDSYAVRLLRAPMAA